MVVALPLLPHPCPLLPLVHPRPNRDSSQVSPGVVPMPSNRLGVGGV